nr:HNH endonuclease family protein [Rubellimicrobium mesophilum]
MPPVLGGDAGDAAQALVLLERIPVEAERPLGFDREDWPHWLDTDRDCQDARQEVLAAESEVPVRWDTQRCDVVSGLWRDAYTGQTVRDPRALDVDHMVPLAEAFRSGGRDWDMERRAAYANDLQDGRTLIAVSASANRSKGDQGPEDWLPPEVSYRCRYVADWVAVKVRWSLSMDERERVTVGNILRACAQD